MKQEIISSSSLLQTHMKHVEAEYSRQSPEWTLTSYSLRILIIKVKLVSKDHLQNFITLIAGWVICELKTASYIEQRILCQVNMGGKGDNFTCYLYKKYCVLVTLLKW